jgi:hypothetical protein
MTSFDWSRAMKRSTFSTRRSTSFVVAALALAAAGSAHAEINYIDYWSTGNRALLCNPAANRLSYSRFLDNGHVQIARGGKVRVRLIGDGADFATGTSESIAGVSARIGGHGTMDRPGSGPMFGGMPQIGYVDVDIDVGSNGALGNASVRARWLSGSERIPIRVVDACPTAAGANSGSSGTAPNVAAPPPRLLIGGTSGGNSQPDLLPQFAPLGLLRHEGPNSRRIDASLCQNLPLPRDPRQAATGEITVGNPRWGVVNAANQGTTAAFQARLSVGDTQILDTQTVAGLAGGQSQLFTYLRPQSRTKVIRIDPLTDVNLKNQYGGGTGCFQLIMAASDPLNWQDPRYTVRVDVLNAVNEGNGGEINNVQVF